MEKGPIRCCVVLPTYQEAEHLRQLIPEIFAQAELLPQHELWVLVVDDNSPDHTAEVLREQAARYPRLRVLQGEKQGLGVAYQRGFAHAMATLAPALLVQMDGDLQHDPAALPYLINSCRGSVGVVIGSRFAPGGATPAFSRRRRWTSLLGNWLVHRATGLPKLYDYTSGFRCLDATLAAAGLAACGRDRLAARGYAFQSSFLCELLWQGVKALELPITFGQRAHGRSKLSRRDYIEFLLNLRRLRARRRQAGS